MERGGCSSRSSPPGGVFLAHAAAHREMQIKQQGPGPGSSARSGFPLIHCGRQAGQKQSEKGDKEMKREREREGEM